VAVSFIGGGNRRTRRNPPTCRRSLINIRLYTSRWSRFELTTSVVIGTDCIGSCKSNYHTINATVAPGTTVFPYTLCHLFNGQLNWTGNDRCLPRCVKQKCICKTEHGTTEPSYNDISFISVVLNAGFHSYIYRDFARSFFFEHSDVGCPLDSS